MTTHYELLRITPDATVEEIRSAYDEQYRQLSQIAMRHHDQSEKLKAEQKRLDLEKSLAVLTDPEKRAEYDAQLGSDQAGGLFDPNTPQPDDQPGSIPFTPPFSKKSVRPDAWVCPKCGSPYPKGTKHCKQDGHQLGVTCPNCGKLTEAAAAHCEHCGVNLKQAIADRHRRIEREEEERALREKQARGKRLQEEQRRAVLAPLQKRADSAWTWTKVGCVVAFFFSAFAMIPWLVALLTANSVLSSPQGVYDDIEIREKARKARMWSGVSLAVVGVLTALSAMWIFVMLASTN